MKKNKSVEFHDLESLASSRARLFDAVGNGVHCPLCKQYCKIYRRKISSGMIRALIKIATAQIQVTPPPGVECWINISKVKEIRSGDYAKLRFWGLLEQRPLRKDEKESGEKSDSARWRVTPLGFSFLSGGEVVPKYIMLYNNKLFGRSDETTDAKSALGDSFRFDEIMAPFFSSLSTAGKIPPVFNQ